MSQLALWSVAGRGVAERVKGEVCATGPGGRPGPRLYVADSGPAVHARTRVLAHRRGDLEVLCRTILRPALAAERVHWSGGHVTLELTRAWPTARASSASPRRPSSDA